jgi:hypothetical protein
MAEERVHSGGNIDIVHSRDYKLDEQREDAIKQAYQRVDERKRRNRILLITAILILILGIGAYLIFK